MAKRETISIEILRQLLTYDKITGILRWRHRADGRTEWNTRYAGTEAGTLDSKGYIQISIFKKLYRAHRLAWAIVTGEWPAVDVDHENLNKSDNRWVNLREATKAQNNANSRKRSHNTSGIKGVYFDNRRGKWTAQLVVARRKIYLGLFDKKEDAGTAYATVAAEHYGQFARVA